MSMVEVLIGLGVFSIFMTLMFKLLIQGYQAFSFLNTRQSVQSQVLRIKTLMSDDFEKTHFLSFARAVHNIMIDSLEVSRHDACCLVLSNWEDPNNFAQPDGVPLWDRYAVYKSSLDELGTLKRVVVTPDEPLPLHIKPLDNLDSTGLGTIKSQVLSDDLYSFEVKGEPYQQKVSVQVVLLKSGGKRGLDDNKVRETFQANFQFNPRNTTGRL